MEARQIEVELNRAKRRIVTLSHIKESIGEQIKKLESRKPSDTGATKGNGKAKASKKKTTKKSKNKKK